MSLEAVWDLRIRTGAGAAATASTSSTSSSISTLTPSSTTDQNQAEPNNLLPYSPRCACVFAAPHPPPPANDQTTITNNNDGSDSSTNPFDAAAATKTNSNSAAASNRPPPPTPRAVVFGSEQGSLHYRCYPSPLFTEDDGGGDAENGSFGNMSSSSSPNRNKGGRSNNNNNTTNVNVPRPALGVSPSGRPPTNVSRIYFPVDLPPKSLPGPVIDVIPAITATSPINNSNSISSRSMHNNSTRGRPFIQQPYQQQQSSATVFLVLVDDHRGSNKQGGAYAATLLTLQNGAFTKVNTTTTTTKNKNNTNNNNQLCHPRFQLPPRISCATYHPKCSGFIVCGGKRIITVPICQYRDAIVENENIASNANRGGGNTNALSRMMVGSSSNKQKQQQQRRRANFLSQNTNPTTTTIDFSSTSLPPPGVRGGQDSLLVTSNGYVAVVAVGNSIYAVPGMEVEISSSASSSLAAPTATTANNNTITTSSKATTAIVNGTSTSALTTTQLSTTATTTTTAPEYTKVYSFGQSSQIHPVLLVDVNDTSIDEEVWSTLLLCNGRECAIVDVHYDSRHYNHNYSQVAPPCTVSPPRNGAVTTSSPIVGAASSWPFVVLLTSDGLLSVRGTSCLAIPLKTLEVGTVNHPNDFFTLRSFRGGNTTTTTTHVDQDDIRRRHRQLQQQQQQQYQFPTTMTHHNNNIANTDDCYYNEGLPWILCMSYSGQAKVVRCKADSVQDLADRLMRISIDAFGPNGFPRNQLAEALHASYTATSYTGIGRDTEQSTAHSRNLLRQYLETALGLADFESGASSGWPTTTITTGNKYIEPSSSNRTIMRNQTNKSEGYNPFQRTALNDDGTNTNNNNNNKYLVDSSPVVTEETPNALLTGTALLCLVCTQLSPSPKGSLANRAARACSSKMGVVVIDAINDSGITNATIAVNEIVAERLLKEASNQSMSLLNNTSSSTVEGMVASSGKRNTSYAQASMHMEFVEAATWLLRSCGRHERAIEVLYERLQQHRAPESSKQPIGFWSQIKYESYTAAHLSELWNTQKEAACQSVLESSATIRLLEHNPQLGLSVFTMNHPQNSTQWRQTADHDDPLVHPNYPSRIVQLLKSINPVIARTSSSSSYHHNNNSNSTSSSSPHDDDYGDYNDDDYDTAVGMGREEIEEEAMKTGMLPLESGRALAVTYLESAIGISSNRPEEGEVYDLLDKSQQFGGEHYEERISDFYDELCFLLLEGVISERGDPDQENTNNNNNHNHRRQADTTAPKSGISSCDNDCSDEDGDATVLGRIYRQKLRRFLRWPLAKIRSERLLESLPKSFLQEQALVLGRLGRHEEAIKILYCNCKSMDLALEYCDMLHKRQVIKIDKERTRLAADSLLDDRANDELDEKFQKENAYLPLVRVALESDPDKKRGIASAIKILAMRRGDIDRSAALRLLPKDLPVSAVARPFLIPALVDSESQERRLKVVSSLLRAKLTTLKHQLTEAQLKAQANLFVVQQQQFKSMNLGDPLHSLQPFKARVSSSASPTFPDVIIVKHFFPRHVVIQAKITNNSFVVDGRALGNLAFVVAESSDDAIQPSSTQILIKVLPYQTTGSAWCVLVASPNRMEGTAVLTCELRYTVFGVNTASGTPLNFGSVGGGGGHGHTGIGIGSGGGGGGIAGISTGGRTFVEEIQDIEILPSHFS